MRYASKRPSATDRRVTLTSARIAEALYKGVCVQEEIAITHPTVNVTSAGIEGIHLRGLAAQLLKCSRRLGALGPWTPARHTWRPCRAVGQRFWGARAQPPAARHAHLVSWWASLARRPRAAAVAARQRLARQAGRCTQSGACSSEANDKPPGPGNKAHREGAAHALCWSPSAGQVKGIPP
jgi:hypothetical protein